MDITAIAIKQLNPINEATAKYVEMLVAKAEKAGTTETVGNQTIEHPQLTSMETLVLMAAVGGVIQATTV